MILLSIFIAAVTAQGCTGAAVAAKNCKFGANFVPQSTVSCMIYNDPPTAAPTSPVSTTAGTVGSTAAPTACSMALATDFAVAACAQAYADFGCSYGCQNCTDGLAPKMLCKSVCDGLKAKCPTIMRDCASDPFNPFVAVYCAADEMNCVKDTIAGTPAVTAGPSPGPTTAGTPASGTTATTVTIADCSTAKDCSTCANGGCQWCSLGMTSETAGTGVCVKTDATCASMYPQSIKSGAECKYDNEKTCEKSNDCKACTGAKANGVQCIWCDTGAKAGVSTGSCSVGPTCKVSSTTPTAADKCPASSVTIAVASLLVASLALFF